MKKLAIFTILILLISSVFAATAVAQTPQVTIGPQNPTINDTVTGYVDGFIQSDYTYNWRVNPGAGNSGAVVSTANPVTVSALGAGAGDVISLEVRWIIPGVFDVPIGNPAQTQVQGQIQPPQGPFNVSIVPTQPTTNDDLTCLVNGFNQSDFQYLWSINGNNVINNTNPLPSSFTNNNDVVTCEVKWALPGFPTIDIGQASVTVGQQGVNNPPTVEITTPQDGASFIVGIPVNFSATATDLDNDALSWAWNFGDGNIAMDNSPASPGPHTRMASNTYTSPGQYTVSVNVNDGSETPGSDSITITILNDTYTVSTLTTHADRTFNSPKTDFYRGEGLYAKFFVTDRMTGQAMTGLDIQATLQHPDGTETPLQAYTGTIAAPGVLSLIDEVRDGENRRTCLSGPITFCTGTNPDGTYYYYIDELSLQDNVLGSNTVLVIAIRGTNGGIAQTTVQIMNNPPVIGEPGLFGRMSPIPNVNVAQGQTATLDLDVYANDVEDPDNALSWTFSGNNLVTVSIDPQTNIVSFSGTVDTTEDITFTLTDTEGDTDTQVVQVVIGTGALQNPVADIQPDSSQNGVIGQVFSFDGTGSYDLDGTIVDYEWNFGDGTIGSGVSTISHSYTALGTYTVTLTVTDNDGLTGTDTATVVVGEITDRPDDNEGRQRRGAFRTIDTHNFKLSSIQAFPWKQAYREGDFITLLLEFKNDGNVDEKLEVKVDMIPNMGIPTLVANQRIGVDDVRWNSQIQFVVPEGTQTGTYTAKIEVLSKGGDHVIEYWTFTVQ